MKKYLLFILLSFIGNITNLIGQTLEEEIGFIYVKAEYLLETGRYEEAIANYNQVIGKSPQYKNALLHRGKAKFALWAYKGTKNDAMQSIELLGTLHENVALLGRAFSAMTEYEASINCFTSAIHLDPKNGEYLYWRAQVYDLKGQKLLSCTDYERAATLGHAEARVKAKDDCGFSSDKPITNHHSNNQTSTQTQNTTAIPSVESNGQNETKINNPEGQTQQETDVVENVPSSNPTEETSNQNTGAASVPQVDETVPTNDNTVNSFVVDDDLSIQISGEELGHRKIKEVPSILILSDENGKVCINICVNKEGVVTKAELNPTLSTILQKSLISLALRKAKEFEFMPGKYESQCGIIIFDVKGS